MIARPPFRGLIVLIALLALWQLAGDPTSPYYPPPSTWWTALVAMSQQGVLFPALGATLQVVFAAIVLVVVIGGALGIAVGRSRRLERLLSPTFEVLRTIPPATAVPVIVLLLGATPLSAIVLTTVTGMWGVVLNVASVVRAIPSTRLDAARSLGLSRLDVARKILVPSAVTGVSLGLRVAAPIVLIVVLLAEMLSSLPGMGRLLIQAQQNFATPRVFAVLAVVGLVGYALSRLVAFLQERLLGAWGAGE